MRQIKFRGRAFSGEWVYGSLLQSEIDINEIAVECEIHERFAHAFSIKKHKVVPKTVGQFTGLHDKNKKEIYEGDIVKVSPENKRLRIVVFDMGAHHFRVPNWEKDKDMPSYPIWFRAISAAAKVDEMPEVVGNIYENAELLNTINMNKVVHCKKEPFDVYIGRPSKWGNPFTHKAGTKAEFILPTREEAIEAYRKWITEGNGRHLLNDLHELNGKVLGCWCKPKSCHGDILVELLRTK